MLRVFLTIVLPLLLPAALYLLWIAMVRSAEPGGAVPWSGVPWLWLAGAGVLLLAIVLAVVTVRFGVPQEGVYVPPHLQNGQVVPGHIEPRAGR